MPQKWAIKFYGSKAWKVTRQIVLRRDGFSCHDCGARAEEIHHIKPLTSDNIKDPMIAHNPDNLMSLCRRCHAARTAGNTGDLPDGYIFDEAGQATKANK